MICVNVKYLVLALANTWRSFVSEKLENVFLLFFLLKQNEHADGWEMCCIIIWNILSLWG